MGAGAACASAATIAKVDGTTMTVKTREGQTVTVKLAEPPRIAAMEKSSLADIKEGSFIGVSAMPQPDGTQKAYGIHIFLDSQKGVVADRFSDWDGRPGSTMTNANVATTVSGKDGQDMLVKYKDGEKKVHRAAGHPDRQVRAGQRRRPQGRRQGVRRRRQEGSRRHADRAEHRGRPQHRPAAMSGGFV